MPDSSSTSAATNAGLAAFGVIYFAVIAATLILAIVINWQIARKAGYQPALSLLMLVPFVNLIIILVFAFTRWPIQDERDRLRAAAPSTAQSALMT